MPNVAGLDIKHMLDFALESQETQKYIPEDWNHTDKEWLQNVLFSVDTKRFEAFIESKVKAAREKREETKVQTACIRPEFAAALKDAKEFSSKSLPFSLNLDVVEKKGRAANMVVDPRESKKRKKEDYEKYGAELKKLRSDPLGYLMALEEYK